MKTWLTRNFSDRYWWFSREYKGIRKELKRTLWEPNKCHKTEISILLTDAFGNCKIKMSWKQLWTIKKFFLSIYEYIYTICFFVIPMFEMLYLNKSKRIRVTSRNQWTKPTKTKLFTNPIYVYFQLETITVNGVKTLGIQVTVTTVESKHQI